MSISKLAEDPRQYTQRILSNSQGQDPIKVQAATPRKLARLIKGVSAAKLRKKPAPDIYNLALERLGLAPRACVAIEDSRNGMLAAYRAGIPVVVTVSEYTRDEDFSEADLVVDSLGDPAGPETTVQANRFLIETGMRREKRKERVRCQPAFQ